MPISGGYKYIVQGHCLLTHWPEWDLLRQETGRTLANWIINNIIYRWGLLLEIVADNGPAFLKVLSHLEKHYHIKHIRISGYNSRANGFHILTSENQYSRHAMERRASGLPWPIQYFGQRESRFINGWVAHPIFLLQEHIPYFHSISQKQTTYFC